MHQARVNLKQTWIAMIFAIRQAAQARLHGLAISGKANRSLFAPAQRQNEEKWIFYAQMNRISASTNTSVAELLQAYPQTASVFFSRKTACVGCYLSRFCSLGDVIQTYELDEDDFLAELNKVIHIQSQEGVKHEG